MSMSQDQFFDAALSLPQSQRADLAFQLLQSLDQPGDELTSEEFATELRERVAAYRRGELDDCGLDEVRAIIEQRLSPRTPQ